MVKSGEGGAPAVSRPGSNRHAAGAIKDALTISVPDRWRKNVPVQVTRARLAIAAGNKALFDLVIENLNSTLINRSEIERLRAQWIESAGS
jgi:hypothetical protein